MTILRTILVAFLIVGTCPAAEPLSAKKLRQIIKSEHDTTPLVEALRIYPKALQYNITITNQWPDGRMFEGKVTATEKWVASRYLVSEAQPVGPETKFTMVVEYDEDEKVYRKYVMMGGKLSGYQVGTRIGETRSVSWIDLSQVKFEPKSDNVTTETHTDKMTTWRSIFFQNGKIQRTETGVATVSKQ